MLRSPQRFVLSAFACALLVALAVGMLSGSTDSSDAQTGSIHNCPSHGRWSIAVWDGASGSETADALTTCGEASIAAAYSLQPDTGAWLRWFAGKPDVSNLVSLDNMQGVLALGVATGPPPPTLAPTSTSAPTSTPAPPALCADPQPPFVTDFDVRQAPDLPEPSARAPFRDPVFGTCVVRVTDRATDVSPEDSSAGMKNEYSRVQSFSADGSRILVRGLNATWYLYDATTLQPIGQMPFGGPVDPRWDATNPDLLYYSEETWLKAYDVRTQEQRLVHDFAPDFPGESLVAVWTKNEGSPSADGRYWGFMAEDQDWVTVALLVYDMQADEVIAKRDMHGVAGAEAIDNAYISPLGNYFIADFSDHYCEPGQLGTDADPCGFMVYDRNLENGRGLLRISGHMDLALDTQGREVAVYQDIDTDHISMLDLATGTVTPLWPIDFSYTSIGLHISGRAFQQQGWALVSTHDGDTASHTWMDDQVFAIELKPDGRLVRLAHTHSLVDETQEHDYWAEPHASVNPDFTRVVFTSNWGRSGTEEVEMFLISLPADWIESLP